MSKWIPHSKPRLPKLPVRGIECLSTLRWRTTILGVGLLCLGCAASPDVQTIPRTPPIQSGTQATATASTEPVPTELGGIIAADCHDEGVTLTALDPETGEATESRSFVLPSSSYMDDCGFRAFNSDLTPFRQQFDQRFERLAVQITDNPDGSVHVGFIDAETGELRDLTALRHPRSDFSGGTSDLHPRFDPSSGKLVVLSIEGPPPRVSSCRPAQFQAIDTETGAVMPFKAKGSDATFLTTCLGAGTTYVLASGGWVIAAPASRGYPVPNPSGTLAAYSSAIGFGSVSIYTPSGDEFSPSGDGFSTGCSGPVSWIDDERFLCSNLTEILEITVDATAERISGRPLTPVVAGRSNQYPVTSPDQEEIAFVSTLGDLVQIFTVSLAGPGEPQLVVTFTADFLVEWR